VGLSILKSWARKAGVTQIPYIGDVTIATIQETILKAYKQLKRLKWDENRRDTWIAQLILAQSTAWNRTKKELWKQLCSTKRILKMANNVRRALHKAMLYRPLAVVTTPNRNNGTRQEMHQKMELEQACLEEAGQRFTQA